MRIAASIFRWQFSRTEPLVQLVIGRPRQRRGWPDRDLQENTNYVRVLFTIKWAFPSTKLAGSDAESLIRLGLIGSA